MCLGESQKICAPRRPRETRMQVVFTNLQGKNEVSLFSARTEFNTQKLHIVMLLCVRLDVGAAEHH